MSVHRRLAGGFLAGAYGQVVSIGVQLLTLPIFLAHWGSTRYGEWLLLSAIPAYLSLSDMGFASVASNQMAMEVAAGERESALRTFHGTLGIVAFASVVVLLIAGLLSVLPLEQYLHLTTLAHREAAAIVSLLAMQVVVGFLGSMLSAGYRSEGQFARVTAAVHTLRLLEFLASIVVVVLGSAGAQWVAVCVLVVRVLGTGWMALDLRRFAPWITFCFTRQSISTARSLGSAALAFAAWPLAAALQQQGLILIIGSLLGAPAVVLWTACRTVARALTQASGIFNSALWPEFSRTLGEGNSELARRLHRLAFCVSLWGILPASVALFLLRVPLFQAWSHGLIDISANLFGLTLVQTILSVLWGTSSIVTAAINRHQRNSLIYVLLIVLGVTLSVPVVRHFGLVGAIIILGIPDLIMLPVALGSALAVVNDHWNTFGTAITRPPIQELRALWKRLLR